MKHSIVALVGTIFLACGFQAAAQVLLATTNQGELVEIDLAFGTSSVVGDAGRLAGKDADAGWTGLSFDASGDLYVVSRQSSEPETGCTASPLNTVMKCAHLYRVDPATGNVLEELGNTQMPFLSDIDFAPGGSLFGSQHDGQGTLVTVNPTTGTGTIVAHFGSKMSNAGAAIKIQNGGLSVHPNTGEIWAVESNFAVSGSDTPSIFKVDAATGMVTGSVITLGSSGVPLTFGFDSLEILPDGRFIGSRGSARNEIYEINPNPDATSGLAEVSLISISVDQNMRGTINGLEYFQPSPQKVEFIVDDVKSLVLHPRTSRKLVGILDSAQAKLDRGQLAKARIKICQFVEELENAVSRNRLSIGDANRLLKDASIVLAQIEFE